MRLTLALLTVVLIAAGVQVFGRHADFLSARSPQPPAPAVAAHPPPLPPDEKLSESLRDILYDMQSTYRYSDVVAPEHPPPRAPPVDYEQTLEWLTQELNNVQYADDDRDYNHIVDLYNMEFQSPEPQQYFHMGQNTNEDLVEKADDAVEKPKSEIIDQKEENKQSGGTSEFKKQIDADTPKRNGAVIYTEGGMTVNDGSEFRKYLDMAESSKNNKILENRRKSFALTPQDNGYYAPGDTYDTDYYSSNVVSDGGVRMSVARSQMLDTLVDEDTPVFQDIRLPRQNPNKLKNIIAENTEPFKPLEAHAEARAHINRGAGDDADVSRTALQMQSSPYEPTHSIYAVALSTAIGAALTVAAVGIAIGWYTMAQNAKAAADADYMGYGVTGPSGDPSGDRKLAHSAHMYMYQHQKQQIIAMERGGNEERTGSISDPESEEENEEGDYTVYECPGFATTGAMEVKNPLFSDDPTPATPVTPATPATPVKANNANKPQ